MVDGKRGGGANHGLYSWAREMMAEKSHGWGGVLGVGGGCCLCCLGFGVWWGVLGWGLVGLLGFFGGFGGGFFGCFCWGVVGFFVP